MKKVFALLALSASFSATAETIDLDQAIALAMDADPRIEERRYIAEAAQGLLDEVKGYGDWYVDANVFVGLAPQIDGSIFKDGGCTSTQCELRDDRYDVNGLTGWVNFEMGIIKPLYTFGKIENYSAAAEANINIKHQDVVLQRQATVLDVKRAYYGYLAARDGRLLLEDVDKRLQGAIDLVEGWLEDGEGDVKQSDLYALRAGQGVLGKYRAQASALEKVALDGLRVVTGKGLGAELEVAERRIRPVPLPLETLEELTAHAMVERPEMKQLSEGLTARRALVEANKSESMPNVYAGVVGLLSYAPGRDRLENPYIYDPFNDAGMTPIIGMKWDWKGGVIEGKTKAAQAELNALLAKNDLARAGIPYQVAEQYHQVQAYHEAVNQLEQASRNARRWMIAAYTDFEAGVEKADKVMMAFQAYVLAMSDYLETAYDYNMHVARLDMATGKMQ